MYIKYQSIDTDGNRNDTIAEFKGMSYNYELGISQMTLKEDGYYQIIYPMSFNEHVKFAWDIYDRIKNGETIYCMQGKFKEFVVDEALSVESNGHIKKRFKPLVENPYADITINCLHHCNSSNKNAINHAQDTNVENNGTTDFYASNQEVTNESDAEYYALNYFPEVENKSNPDDYAPKQVVENTSNVSHHDRTSAHSARKANKVSVMPLLESIATFALLALAITSFIIILIISYNNCIQNTEGLNQGIVNTKEYICLVKNSEQGTYKCI